MPIPLLISIIVIVISLVLIVHGAVYSDIDSETGGGLIAVGIVAFILDIVFGFLILCNSIEIRSEKAILMPEEIAKSQYTVYVKCDGQSLSSTEARFVMASNDLIRVEKRISFNSYDKECAKEWTIVVVDDGK